GWAGVLGLAAPPTQPGPPTPGGPAGGGSRSPGAEDLITGEGSGGGIGGLRSVSAAGAGGGDRLGPGVHDAAADNATPAGVDVTGLLGPPGGNFGSGLLTILPSQTPGPDPLALVTGASAVRGGIAAPHWSAMMAASGALGGPSADHVVPTTPFALIAAPPLPGLSPG